MLVNKDPQEHPANNPQRWEDELSGEQQTALLKWIRYWLRPARNVFPDASSYGLKHVFECDPGGFYVSNGAFKGAMLAAGFPPVRRVALNWDFRIRFITQRERLIYGV